LLLLVPGLVGGTAWAAQLATFEVGEALGSFNGMTAMAAVIAAFAAGLVAHHLGYGIVLIIGAVASLLALFCFVPLLPSAKRD